MCSGTALLWELLLCHCKSAGSQTHLGFVTNSTPKESGLQYRSDLRRKALLNQLGWFVRTPGRPDLQGSSKLIDVNFAVRVA